MRNSLCASLTMRQIICSNSSIILWAHCIPKATGGPLFDRALPDIYQGCLRFFPEQLTHGHGGCKASSMLTRMYRPQNEPFCLQLEVHISPECPLFA